MVVISVYTYRVKIILKIRWESGFLRGFHRTPYALTGGRGTLCSYVLNSRGVLSEKVGTDDVRERKGRVPFRPLRFTNGPFLFEKLLF